MELQFELIHKYVTFQINSEKLFWSYFVRCNMDAAYFLHEIFLNLRFGATQKYNLLLDISVAECNNGATSL